MANLIRFWLLKSDVFVQKQVYPSPRVESGRGEGGCMIATKFGYNR
jgi:hypothetical protein